MDWNSIDIPWSGETRKLCQLLETKEPPFIARVALSNIGSFNAGYGPNTQLPIVFYKSRKRTHFIGKPLKCRGRKKEYYEFSLDCSDWYKIMHTSMDMTPSYSSCYDVHQDKKNSLFLLRSSCCGYKQSGNQLEELTLPAGILLKKSNVTTLQLLNCVIRRRDSQSNSMDNMQFLTFTHSSGNDIYTVYISFDDPCKMTPAPGKTNHPSVGAAYRLLQIRDANLPLNIRCVYGRAPVNKHLSETTRVYELTKKKKTYNITSFLFSEQGIYIMDIPVDINILFEIPENDDYKRSSQFLAFIKFIPGLSSNYKKKVKPIEIPYKRNSSFPFSKRGLLCAATHIAEITTPICRPECDIAEDINEKEQIRQNRYRASVVVKNTISTGSHNSATGHVNHLLEWLERYENDHYDSNENIYTALEKSSIDKDYYNSQAINKQNALYSKRQLQNETFRDLSHQAEVVDEKKEDVFKYIAFENYLMEEYLHILSWTVRQFITFKKREKFFTELKSIKKQTYYPKFPIADEKNWPIIKMKLTSLLNNYTYFEEMQFPNKIGDLEEAFTSKSPSEIMKWTSFYLAFRYCEKENAVYSRKRIGLNLAKKVIKFSLQCKNKKIFDFTYKKIMEIYK
ncbi:DgyrCDS8632 [Dimorphilus gyrociliatus]|uniref:DgyrCDS8632 n=1 Tax=Dimorphilus gyrociliatus TaxID=2664684 RepID=A0A7I8VUQ1_9ANNE|nr:DgyrCDS8632 [Dimorphilus gyrociliatus]